jgi:hypothetical protein
MQHARLTGSGSTGRTGHDGYLFGGEFFLFHCDRMRKYRARNSSILHTIPYQLATKTAAFPYRERFNSVVQDNTQKGIVYVDRALVLDEA